MMFKPSKYQQAIFDFVEHESGSVIVEAVAGSGKTKTIVEALKLVPKNKRTAFLAFNKAIAVELDKRIPENVEARTMNSLGYGAYWLSRRDIGGVKVVDTKIKSIAQGVLDRGLIGEDMLAVCRLVGVAKNFGLIPGAGSAIDGGLADLPRCWLYLIEHFGIETEDIDIRTLITSACAVLKKSNAVRDVIDYDDQIYLTVILKLRCKQYDVLFVDEAQDISPIQRALLARSLTRGGRLIAVGDSRQAIYGFRGSDSESLNAIAKKFSAKRLPLSISYRCPRKVVEAAKVLAPEIESADGAKDGIVRTLTSYDESVFDADSLVVCRTNAPLIKLAYQLIGRKVPLQVMGRDIGQGLIALIRKLKAATIFGRDGLVERLEKWREGQTARFEARGEDSRVQSINDKYESLSVFIHDGNSRTIAKLVEDISTMFVQKNNERVLTLATVHKAKGLEAKNIFILNPGLMPAKFAKQDWELEQEANIEYVAITRAIDSLNYIQLDDLAPSGSPYQTCEEIKL